MWNNQKQQMMILILPSLKGVDFMQIWSNAMLDFNWFEIEICLN